MKRIYFDNASTTPLIEEVKAQMISIISDNFGNPSSIHHFGRQAKIIVEDSRSIIAKGLCASTGEIFFTSGATESNNMALLCSIRDLGIQKIISSPIEHHCILHTLEYIQKNNLAEVHFLKVDHQGHIDYNELENYLSKSDKKIMVSLMHANNEIGTIHDIEKLSHLCKDYKVLFHTDTAQTIGKKAIDVSEINISFLSGSAHKFFGPKGSGFVYINLNNMIKPLFHGGDQERGIRSGTENIYGISGMAAAFKSAVENMNARNEINLKLRNYCLQRMQDELSDIAINGSTTDYLSNILSVSFPPSDKVDMLMMNLDINGICASSGSACSSGVENDSHVLNFIGHPPERKTIRFSFSHLNSKLEIDQLIDVLKKLTPIK